jgi:hypothetical protein
MLFKNAPSFEASGWRRVSLEGYQVRFLNDQGTYRYGVCRLRSTSIIELETEIVQPQADSRISFAVIDARQIAELVPRNIPAFRHDLDFYVFTSVTAEAHAALEACMSGPDSAVLCLTTQLEC